MDLGLRGKVALVAAASHGLGFAVAQEFARGGARVAMRRGGGGSLTSMTSSTVRQPTQYLNLILSTAIRSAVQGMAKTLSADLAKDGIRVNAVQPGRIATDRLMSLEKDTAQRANV